MVWKKLVFFFAVRVLKYKDIYLFFPPQRVAARPRASWIPTLDAVTWWLPRLRVFSSQGIQQTHALAGAPLHSRVIVAFVVLCTRPASAGEDQGFENNLEQQLEEELKMEELVQHRQETDKTCMVGPKPVFLIYWITNFQSFFPHFLFVCGCGLTQVTLQQWPGQSRWLVSFCFSCCFN